MTIAEPRTAADQRLADLFRQHHVDLVRLAVLLVRDQPTAEDAVQEVFARLQASGRQPGRKGEELAYLRACVLNGCRSVLRRRILARRIDACGQVFAEPATSESAEAAAIRSQERREVLTALAGLSTRRREVLVLRYFLGLSESEIAATLGISNGAVKSTAARGLASLAKALGEEPS
ncbi:MAG TPA: sigma-70 family RNA polymerase sigma factor [Streptosporangiaceae bacterium]|nr:sigma-70 family RNA polymerase sigma factor [Streptosporangiaceae bacterium]